MFQKDIKSRFYVEFVGLNSSIMLCDHIIIIISMLTKVYRKSFGLENFNLTKYFDYTCCELLILFIFIFFTTGRLKKNNLFKSNKHRHCQHCLILKFKMKSSITCINGNLQSEKIFIFE